MRNIMAWLARLDAGGNDDDLAFIMSAMSTLVIAEVFRKSIQQDPKHADEALGPR